MGKFDGCLLACDVDGTLVCGDIFPENNIRKIAEFVSEGGTFSLATGRSVGAVNMVLSRIKELIGPSVVANGCMIYNYQKDEVVLNSTIPDDVKELVFEAAEKFEGFGIEIHNGWKTFLYKDEPEVRDHQSYEGLDGKVATRSEVEHLGWNKALFTNVNPDEHKKIDEFFEERCKNAVCVPTNADIYGRKRHYREILPTGVNKASALSELVKILGVKKGGFFAIGDYMNDISMLKIADISACPENSPSEVKEVCDFHTTQAQNGAVADFIDYLMSKEI